MPIRGNRIGKISKK